MGLVMGVLAAMTVIQPRDAPELHLHLLRAGSEPRKKEAEAKEDWGAPISCAHARLSPSHWQPAQVLLGTSTAGLWNTRTPSFYQVCRADSSMT